MKRFFTLCSVALFSLLPILYCQAEGSKDIYPAGALGNRAYMTSSSTATSALIGNIYNPGRMFVYAKVGEVIYVGSSAQGIGTGTTRLTAPNGNAYNTSNSTTVGRINNRAEELLGPSALAVGGYNGYSRTVQTGEQGIWTIEFDPPNTSATALGNGFSPPAANAAWTIANQTAVSTLALIVAWDVTVASVGIPQSGRTFLNIFTGNAGTASSAFYGKFNVLTKDGFTYTAASNGIQPFLFAFFVNNKGTRDRATGVPVYKSVDLNSVVSANGAYSFHNPTLPDDATNITQKLFYNTPDNTLPANAPVWVNGAASTTWLISTPVTPVVSQVFFTGREGTPGRAGTPPLNGGYVHFTANQNGNFKISIDVNNNGSTNDPIDRIITGSSVAGDNAILWDGKDGLGTDVANGANINISVVLYSGEVHFPYMDVENNANGIIITRTNGSNAPDPTVYWNDQLLGSGSGAPVPVNASASPGINSTTNGHKYTNSYGDNSLLDTWAYIFSAPQTASVIVKQYQADLEVVNNIPALTAICAGHLITYTTTIRNNGPDSANGARYSFTFPSQFTPVNVTSTGNGIIVSGGFSGNAYTAVLNLANGAVVNYSFTGTITDVPAGGNLVTKSSVMRPPDVTDPDATSIASGNPTDPDVECNGAPSGAGCNNIKTSSIPVSPAITNNTISAAQSVCIGNTPAPLTGSTIAGTPQYLWQSSIVSGTAGFISATGTNNGKDYTPAVLSQSTWYRRIVNAGSCSDTSAAIMITINPLLTPGAVAGNQSFCNSGDPVMFTQTVAATGGNGTYTYRWQSSLDNISFNDIFGATQATYDAPVVSQTTYFRRIVSSGSSGCADMISDTLTVQINTTPTTANAGSDQNLCNVTSATLSGNTPANGNGAWQQTGGPVTAVIADTTLPGTSISGLTNGIFTFVWTIRNGNCPPSKDTVVINVSSLPTVANAGPDQPLCNVTSAVLAGNTPTAGTGQWSQIAGPNTASFVDATQPNTAVQNLQPGTYSLVWTISSGPCAPSADTMQLIISAAPATANAGPDQTKYNNGEFTISGNTPSSGQGTWAVVSGNAVIGSTTTPATTATLQPNTTATLTWTITSGNCPPSIDTIVLTYTSQADLKVTKSDAGNTYKTNSPLTYTITIENAGPSDIYGFTLKDTLPALMTSASWTSAVTGTNVALRPLSGAGNIITANGDIPFAAGNKIVITVTGTVAANAIGGNVITNTATVSNPSGLPDPVPGNNISTVTGAVPNNPPVAVDDNYTTIRDVPVSGNVLTNDSDPENQPITVSATLIQSPASGSVIQNADGTFTYTPVPGFVGTDTYIYQVCDNQGACSQATVTITVTKGMAHLTIAKIATPATASAGGPLTYTLTVTNNGPSTILSSETFSVVDTLPVGFIASSYTPSAGSYNNGNWTGVTLKPGASVTLTIAGNVASSFAGASLTNTASATPPSAIPDSTPATTTLVTPVTKAVEVVVTKTDNTTTYVPGTTTQYKITVVNKGPADLINATFQDPLPAGITTASWTAVTPGGGQANASGNGAINETISLPSGSTIVYTLTITIPSNYTGSLTNTASIVVPSGYNNINPSGNSATDTDTPNPQFSLEIDKSGPASAVAGTSLSYDVIIVNNGPSDLTGAAVLDHLPVTLQNPVWTVTTTGSATASVSSGTGDVSFTAGIVAGVGNKITIHITGTINPGATGTLTNTASITPPGSPTLFSNTVNTVIERSTGITLVKQGPSAGHVTAGQPISYQLKLTNAGPSNAVGIVLSDVVPPAITNVSWVVSTAGTAEVAAGSASSGTGNNISTTVNIPAGLANVVTLQINGTVSSAATDTLLNTATARLAGDTTVTAFNKTIVENKPGLQVVKAGPATADAGTNITYTITVNNSGPSNAVNAVISDVVGPTTMTNVTWTATAAGNAVINSGANGNGNTLSVNVNIPAGSSNSVTIVVQGTILSGAAGDIRNTATVAVNGQQPVMSNEVITQITNRAGLVVTKTGPVTATAGGSASYLLKITNTGPSDALNAVLLDTLGSMLQNPGITTLSHGNASVTSSQITNRIAQVVGNIPAGDSNSIDVIIQAKIDPSFVGQIRNQGFISTNNGPVVSSNAVITDVANKPILTITKAGKDTAVAGQSLNYTISVGNTGLSDAVNVNILDAVPAGLSNVSWTTSLMNGATIASGATGTGSNINVTGNIPAGKQASITINVSGTITPSFTGDLSNFATAAVNGDTPIPSDTVVTHVVSKPALQITKSGPGNVSAGGFIRYTLQITNSGPSDAVNVNIADPVNGVIQATNWLTSVSGGASISSGATGNGNNVAIVANIPAGTGSITVYVDGTVNAGAAGTVNNTATATVTGMPPVSASSSAVVTNDPLISISKTGPAQANAGETISYTLVVTNYGKSNAKNVIISDLVPSQLTNVSWSTTTAGSINVNTGGTGTGNNVAVLADVDAGTQNHLFVTVTGTIAPDFTGTFINSSRAIVNHRDTSRSDTVTTIVAGKPGIQLVKTSPDTVAAGGIITYTITATNIGPSDAPLVTITDALPVFIKNVNWSAVAAGRATVQVGGGTGNNVGVQGSIPAGAGNMITLTITGTVDPAFTGDLNNVALATPGTLPPISSNTTVTHVVKKIALALSKSGPSQEAAGEDIIYLLRLSNNGPSDAPGVQFFDTIPAAIKNVTWTAVKTGNAVVLTGATGTGNQVVVTGDIPAGAANNNIVILVKGVIDPAYTGASLRNIAYASSPDQPIPVMDTATTRVVKQSLLKLSKSGPSVLFAGDPITYTIHLQNGGPSDAVNVQINDIIDPAILNPSWKAIATGVGTSVSDTGSLGNISLNGNIPAGAGHSIDITVTGILNPDYTGDSIVNSAVATLAGQVPVASTVNTQVLRRANLRIVKSGPGSAAAGEKINYTITVNNLGPSNVTGLTITDIIPASLLQPVWTATAAGTGSSVSASNGTGNINLTGNLPVGTGNSITITVNGIIDPSATDSSFLVNTASVAPPPDFENTNPVNATAVTLVRKQADLVIVKSGPANIAAGQNISYQLLVTNRGISDVTHALISDAVPAGVAITNVTATTTGNASAGTAVVNGNNITLTGDIVAGIGNSIIVKIDGTVNPAATGTITNTATVAPPADVKEMNPANNTSSISTIISTNLGLQVSKSGPASVNILDQITYTIVLTNSGVSDASEVTVTDVVPADITGVTWTATATGNAGVLSAANGSGNNINLSARVGGSNSGTVTITVTGTVSATAAATITNTVTATALGSSSSTVVTSVNNSVDLRINKTAPTNIVAGEEITYVVTVTNGGPADAIGAAITDAMPAAADVQHVTWTATATGGANVTPTSGTGDAGIFLAADIPANTGVVTITIKGTVNPAASGVLDNAASTVPGFGQTDPTPAQVLVSTNVTTVPGLSVVKSGPAQVIAGDTMSYTLQIHNSGPSDATGVTIKDTIPGAVTGITWSAAATNATITDPGTGTGNIVAIVGDIPAGGSVTVHIAGKTAPAFEGFMINHAVVSGNGQTVVSNDVRTLVQNKPGLTIRKSGPARAAAGAQISYAIAIANNGLSAANGITVSDLLPPNLKNPVWSAAAGGSAAIVGGNISNHPGDVSFKANVPAGSGNTIVVNISGTIDAAAIGSLTNVATATLANGTPTADTVVTQLATQTGVRLLKAAPDKATAGTTITYTLDVYNDGPSNAVNVNVADVIPAQLKDSKWSATAAGAAVVHGGNLQQQPGNVAFTADIPAGSSNAVHVVITGVIQADYTGAVNNQATATAGGVNYLSNNVVTQVVSKPGLRIVKSGPSTGVAGGAISYNIILTNEGPSDAANIKIADILPAQVQQPVWSATAAGNAVITGGNVTNQTGDVSLVASVPAGAANRIVVNVSGTIMPSFTGNITNIASYSLDGNSVNTPPVITEVIQEVKVKVSKSAPDTIAAGGKINYTLLVTNEGLSDVNNIVINDLVPAAIQQVSWNAVATGATINGTNSGTGNTISVNASIPAGPQRNVLINISGVVASSATGIVENKVTVNEGAKVVAGDSVDTHVTNKSGIQFTKSGPRTAVAGSAINYTIILGNNGPSDLVNAKVADLVPVQVENVTWNITTTGTATLATGTPVSGTGNQVAFTANVPAGTGNEIKVLISGTVAPGFVGNITNTAQVTDNGNVYTSNVKTTVQNSALLTIEKIGPDTVSAGSSISYLITATNQGPSDGSGISITDLVPVGITNVSWTATTFGSAQITGPLSGTGNNITVNGNIPAGITNKIQIVVDGLVPPDAIAESITNTATLRKPDTTTISSTVNTKIRQLTALTIHKVAPATANAGDSLRYNITVANNGPSDARNIQITDLVSDTLTGVRWVATTTGNAQIIGAAQGTGNTVSLRANIGADAANAIQVMVVGKINPDFVGKITNNATATDAAGKVNSAAASTIVGSKPSLHITKTSVGSVNAGDTIRYLITAANDGPSNAAGVSITDNVPAAITNVTWTATANGTSQVIGTSSGSGNSILVHGNIDAGVGNTIVVNIMGVVPANATVASLSNIAILNDSIPSDSVITHVTKKPNVHVVKQAAATAIAGDSLRYTITVTNDGPSDASGVKISDIVSDTLSGVNWTATTTGAAQITGSSSGTGNVALAGNIAAGTGNAISIQIAGKINPDFTGTITNTASATDANNNTTTGTATTQVTGKSALSITKTGSTSVKAGEVIHYVVVATNAGPSTATGISITDLVPATITNVTWTAVANGTSQLIGPATGSGNSVSVKGNLAAGNSNTIQVNIDGIIPADVTITSVSNTATLNPGTGTSIPSAPVVTTVVPAVKTLDLSITKSGPAALFVNDSITYELNAQNAGPAAGDGAVITDILPVGIEGAYAVVTSLTGGAANVQLTNAGNVVKAAIGSFPAGAGIRIIIRGKVTSTASLRNQAVIAAPDGIVDSRPENNTSASVITVINQVAMADLQVQKELLNTTPLRVGGKAEFAITLNNAGPVTTTGISVRDTLNSNLEIVNGFDASIGTINYDPNTRIIIWTLDSLRLTQTATLKYTARVTNTGVVANRATATAQVTDPNPANNSASSKEMTITGDDILIPNVITPNGDGKNDKLVIIGVTRYPNSSLFIYNRWGNMVFQSKNYQNNWDGNGLNEGTYYYILKLNTPNGERSYKGWIELLR
ncbi:MAG: DUF11 domain-containing protein [Chitinophaga sp.]|uniref:T9SS type B sorting domain-containing protein n=1 Tax=Chitinophaga sp. TaxID=1869181 RepID=UPI001B17E228|nr:gliding motility-associated C-terminal domain-containing protein [Chitinophaga sp.]MBO9732900.1 DUF11 domain-containing protein [Chitinophaga sp.]